MIKTQYMKNLLDQLEANTKLSGQIFRKKIFMVIDGVKYFDYKFVFTNLHIFFFASIIIF